MTETLKKGTRVTGADRTKLASDLKKRYDAGESIRSLAASTGRSYGFVHRILSRTGFRCVAAAAPPGARRGPSADRYRHRPGPRRPAGGCRCACAGRGRPSPWTGAARRNAMTPAMWHGLATIGRPCRQRCAWSWCAGRPVLLGRHRPALVLAGRRARRGPAAAPGQPWIRGVDRVLPGGIHLAAPPGHHRRWRRSRGTPSAPASSSPWPATCGFWPTTRSSA